MLRREPLGPVGLISAWNYPMLIATVRKVPLYAPRCYAALLPEANSVKCLCVHVQWKVAPALAAGCTVVLKPSEMASLTCLELAAIAEEVQLPPGVLNVVTGLGVEAGAPLRCGACTPTKLNLVLYWRVLSSLEMPAHYQ